MKFYMVRHVETTGNIENRFAGITETGYTENGLRQFEVLTKKLAEDFEFDSIYSSPISRAKKIACAVGKQISLKVNLVPSLSEMNFGIFENRTFNEIQSEDNHHWNKWNEDYVNYQIPEGDSLAVFHKKVSDFVDRIKHQHGASLVVCHGGTIQSMVTHLLNLEIEKRWNFHIPLGGMVEIDYENDFGVIRNLMKLVE